MKKFGDDSTAWKRKKSKFFVMIQATAGAPNLAKPMNYEMNDEQ